MLKSFKTLKYFQQFRFKSIVSKINNTKQSMTDMKPKDVIKLNIDKLHKCETCPKEELLPENGLCKYVYQLGEQLGDQKNKLLTLPE